MGYRVRSVPKRGFFAAPGASASVRRPVEGPEGTSTRQVSAWPTTPDRLGMIAT
jgi:hypothetical protein